MNAARWAGLEGRCALVTGGTRGIGREIAKTLLTAGSEVWLTSRSDEGAQEAARELAAEAEVDAARAHGFALDLSAPEEAAKILGSFAKERQAANGLDFLVHNAGMTRDGLLMRMSLEQWNSVLEANLTGAFLVTRALLPGMIRSRFGRIVLLSSVVARMGNPGQTNYAASKAGMIGFVRSLAREVALRGITVNAVAPGFIDTEMTRSLPDAAREKLLELVPLGRFGHVGDVAGPVAFLLSEAGSYLTGTVLDVNGGMDM